MKERNVIPKDLRGFEQNSQVILPGHTNHHNTFFGGQALAMMDIAAAIAAQRFCHKPVVTAKLTEVNFKVPLRVGDMAVVTAETLWHGRTSIGVSVTFWREELNGNRTECTTSEFVMICIDKNGKPYPIYTEDGKYLTRQA